MKNQKQEELSPQSEAQYIEPILQLLQRYSNMLEQSGYRVKVANETSLSRLRSLDHSFLLSLRSRLETLLQVHDGLIKAGIDFKDNTQCLWNIFKNFGWQLDSDLFSRVQQTDIIEIFLADETQVFRTFNYFSVSSYDLLSLFIYPWHELFDHGTDQAALTEMIGKLFADELVLTDGFGIESEHSAEKMSACRYQVKLTSRFAKGIRSRKSKKIEALIAVWDIQLVGRGPGFEEVDLGDELW